MELSIIKAIILGALQGATEFLPVSSSGHLVIAQDLLGVKLESSSLLAFDVCLHFGTLLAVVAVFWRDLVQIILGFFGKRYGSFASADVPSPRESRKLGWMIILGTIPAVIAVLFLDDFFESLVSNPMAAAFMLLVTGTILWLTRFSKVSRSDSGLGWFRTIIIGCAQAAAIIPGISRSGSTISVGLFFGMDRSLAAKFSFLLAVPAILGATVMQLGELSALSNDILLSVIVGTVVAALVGFVCIKWLLALIRRGHFSVFGYYCWLVGLATIIYKVFFGN